MKDLPVQPKKAISPAENAKILKEVQAGLARLDDKTLCSAYQAWLGFYNGMLKKCGWTKEELVAAANDMVLNTLGRDSVPQLEAKTVGMMGMKGVPGLVVNKGPRGTANGGTPRPPQGGIGGGRGGNSGGGERRSSGGGGERQERDGRYAREGGYSTGRGENFSPGRGGRSSSGQGRGGRGGRG